MQSQNHPPTASDSQSHAPRIIGDPPPEPASVGEPGPKWPGERAEMCGVETVCPRCGSQDLASIKCKLICQSCHAIVMNCCEF